MAVAELLADKSAWARARKPAVREALEPLLTRGVLATCGAVDLEILFSSRDVAEHDRLREQRSGLEWLAMPDEVWDRAIAVHRELAARGAQLAVPVPDLLIAATAERHGVTVLHYDADFDLIAEITGQPARWVVPRGTAD